MKHPFEIILVEDNDSDAELLEIQLKKLELDFDLIRVENSEECLEILDKHKQDLIISDYNFPGMNGFELLSRVRDNDSHLPFILVSGYIGEEKAVDAMLKGASDYVLKDNLERLVPAVQRELLQYWEYLKTESERDEAIHKLKERVKEQKCLYAISSLNNQKLSIDELLRKSVKKIPSGWQYPKVTEAIIEFDGNRYQTKNYRESKWDLTSINKKIKKGPLRLNVVYLEEKPVADIGPFIKEEQYLINSIIDILSMKINQILDQQELEKKQRLLEEERDRLLEAQRVAEMGDWNYDVDSGKITWSSMVFTIFERDPVLGEPAYEEFESYFQSQNEYHNELVEKAIKEAIPYSADLKLKTDKGNDKYIHVEGKPKTDHEGKVIKLFGTTMDITNRKRAEEALQASEQRLKSFVHEGMDLIAIIDEEGFYKYVAPTKHRVEEMGRAVTDFYGRSIYDIIHPDYHDLLKNSINSIAPYESVTVEPFQYMGRDDEWRWMESTITNLTENPAINGYVTNSRDVTERIERERKLRDIVEHSTNLFYRRDINNVLTYVSSQSYEFLGCSPKAAKMQWTEFLTDHPDNERAMDLTEKAIEIGEAQLPYELQLKKANGEKIWVRVNEAPVVENGKAVAIVGSLTDITEQKKYEERLEELSLVASKTTDVIIMTDAEDKTTWVNDAFENVMGYTLEESIGMIPGKLLRGSATDLETAKRIQEAKIKQDSIQEVILNYTKDGRELWLDMTADPIFDNNGDFVGYIAIDKDVTEKIRQQKKLEESLETFEIVTKATSDTIWDADLVEDTVEYNYNIKNVFGYEIQDEITPGAWWVDKIHPDDRNRVTKAFELAELENKERIQIEYRFQAADGSYKFVNDRAFIIDNENGKPVRMIGAIQDITKQKEENLWLKLLESAIANTTESIAILEEKKPGTIGRKILYVNNAFEQMTGFTKNDILGDSLLKLVGPNTNSKTVAKTLRDLDRGNASQVEVAYKNKEGKEAWAQISFAPVRSSNSEITHWVCIGRDTTDRRKKEAALRESLQEKETLLMEIHHRVKNNLAVVSSMMHLQAMQEEDESLQKKLYDSVMRIRTMVTIHELLYESKNFSKINFSENLEKLVAMIIETIHNGQKIEVEYNCEKLELNVNQAIPASLIVNEVVTNAIKHAFTGRNVGKINLEVKVKHNNKVYIQLRDNGKGLPRDYEKNGASLGMQLIDVLAEQMDAEYQYAKASEEGTIFEIRFEKNLVKGIGNAYLK